MKKHYPSYTWEAHEVTSGDWTQTLFRITKSAINKDFTPTRQPVLLMQPYKSYVTDWFATVEFTNGETKKQFVEAQEADLWNKLTVRSADEDRAKVESDYAHSLLDTYMEKHPKRWETLYAKWKENTDNAAGIAVLDKILEEHNHGHSHGDGSHTHRLRNLSGDHAVTSECAQGTMDYFFERYDAVVKDIDTPAQFDKMEEYNKNTPITLFNYGFDVWVAGHRGTLYNTENSKASKSDAAYWNFSYKDASADVLASIDYISSATDKKVSYVGYEGGNQLMWYLLAMQGNGTEYAALDKVESFHAVSVCPWFGVDPSDVGKGWDDPATVSADVLNNL